MSNVVLICLDTVRKDFFDTHAERIADISTLNIDQCRATSAWSTPSHAGMFTGRLPHQHGIDTYQRTFEDVSVSTTLFGNIQNHTTLGVSANVFAGPSHGFDHFFDEFKHMSSAYHRFPKGLDPHEYSQSSGPTILGYWGFLRDTVTSDHPIASFLNGVTGLARKANRHTPFQNIFDDGANSLLNEATSLVGACDEPYFLFANVMDAHLPLEPHRYMQDNDVPRTWSTHGYDQWDYVENRDEFEEYWAYREELYAATIKYLDRTVSAFIQAVRDRSSEPVSFIITADHGENLGLPSEDGLVNHTSSLSEGILHVPLCIVDSDDVVSSPGDRLVSHLDLPDLITALATGRSFEWEATPRAEVMGMGPNPEPPSRKEFWDRTIRCVYDNDRKYVWDTQGNELVYEFDRSKSCWQREVDEPFSLPSRLRSLFECDIDTARERALENQQSVSVSESTEDRLEELGYL